MFFLNVLDAPHYLKFCFNIKCISCCSVANSVALIAKLEVRLYRRPR